MECVLCINETMDGATRQSKNVFVPNMREDVTIWMTHPSRQKWMEPDDNNKKATCPVPNQPLESLFLPIGLLSFHTHRTACTSTLSLSLRSIFLPWQPASSSSSSSCSFSNDNILFANSHIRVVYSLRDILLNPKQLPTPPPPPPQFNNNNRDNISLLLLSLSWPLVFAC
jgi:hypothetical protein